MLRERSWGDMFWKMEEQESHIQTLRWPSSHYEGSEANSTEADVYMYEKHTRTLTSTLLEPSDSETGNGERFAV
jgi:hypothetical protein